MPPYTLPFTLLSTGVARPARLVTSEELDGLLALEPGSVLKKSGVLVRALSDQHDSQSRLGARALQDALARASLTVSDVDLVLGACGVQEQALPNTASAIAAEAGLPEGVPAIDINASCLSFLVALNHAAALLAVGQYRRIAIVSADLPSRGLNWRDPEASYIFGDGAAAAIVQARPALASGATAVQLPGMRAFKFATFPQGRALCEIRAGGTRATPRDGAEPEDFLFRMNGKGVFKLALQHLEGFLGEMLSEARLQISDIDWVVPHQASHLGMSHAASRLGLPAERVVDVYATHGNQVGASLPTALHALLNQKPVKQGDKVLLLGTAAGLSLGAAVVVL